MESLDIAFANVRLMWLTLVQPVCKFNDRFHKVAQAIPQTLFTILFLIFPIVSYADIKIGYIGPITGNYSEYAEGIKNGVEIAIQEYNKEVSDDLKINFVFRDSNGDIKNALAQINELSSDSDVICIIFPGLYNSIQGLYETANKLKIVVISPTPISFIEPDNQYVFENCLNAEDEAKKIADFAVHDMDKKKFAIVHSDDSYDVNLASIFSKHLKSLGARIIEIEKYKTGDTDFKEQMLALGGIDPAKIKEREEKKALPDEINPKGIEAIYIAGSWKEASLIIPQLIFYELRTLVFGCSKFDSTYLIEYGGKALNGVVYPSGFFLKRDSMKTKNFVKSFIEKFGYNPDILTAQAYDSVCLVVELVKLGCKSRNEIRDTLLRVKKFEGVTGNISFNNTTKAKRDVPLVLIDNGELVEIE